MNLPITSSIFKGIPQVDSNLLQFTNQVLGRGSFGKVVKATYGEHGFVAVKLMDYDCGEKRERKSRSITREIKNLHTYGSGSEHIVAFYGVTNTPKLGYAMEFMDCGSLDDLLNDKKHLEYRIDHVFSWLNQVAMGARYMHSVGLVHRDLKPHNLLLRDCCLTIKIGDFGLVGELKQSMTNGIGSAPWMAPEVFMGNKYSTACDVYSLGIILWQMVTRKLPYPKNTTSWAILRNRAAGERPQRPECNHFLWRMIEKMWAMEPEERPSMDHVCEYAMTMMKMYNGHNDAIIVSQSDSWSESTDTTLTTTTTETLCSSAESAKTFYDKGSVSALSRAQRGYRKTKQSQADKTLKAEPEDPAKPGRLPISYRFPHSPFYSVTYPMDA